MNDSWLDREYLGHFSLTLALFNDHFYSCLELLNSKLLFGKLTSMRLAETSLEAECEIGFLFV